MDYGRPPVLTEEERRVNTEKAIAARCRRAEVKQQLHDGKISLEDVLSMKDDPVVNRMRIEELIRAMPGIGVAKATKIMEGLGIDSEQKTDRIFPKIGLLLQSKNYYD